MQEVERTYGILLRARRLQGLAWFVTRSDQELSNPLVVVQGSAELLLQQDRLGLARSLAQAEFPRHSGVAWKTLTMLMRQTPARSYRREGISGKEEESTMTASDAVVEAFTELAPRYADTMDRELRMFWGLRYKDFISQLVEIVPIRSSDVVLDVATGTARIPMTMVNAAEDGSVSVGLDITPAMLKYGLASIKANGLSSRIKLVCASAMDMPFSEGLFDMVICGFAMHHMDVPRVLSEITRVLKESGQLVLADVTAPSLWRASVASALLWIAALSYGLTHWRSARIRAEVAAIPNIRTVTEWRTILSDFGFEDIEIVAEFAGRRPWYPAALALRATKKGR